LGTALLFTLRSRPNNTNDKAGSSESGSSALLDEADEHDSHEAPDRFVYSRGLKHAARDAF